jgi:hypothetical protein
VFLEPHDCSFLLLYYLPPIQRPILSYHISALFQTPFHLQCYILTMFVSEDGTIDPNGRSGGGTYHKLGPKANQGAINAGLRALDRSGAPCRKWTKGGFKLKSFTGVLWEIPRWTAPPKPKPEVSTEEPAASAESSNKENKDASQQKSENSASNAGAEPQSIPPSVHASSPAPMAIAAS